MPPYIGKDNIDPFRHPRTRKLFDYPSFNQSDKNIFKILHITLTEPFSLPLLINLLKFIYTSEYFYIQWLMHKNRLKS